MQSKGLIKKETWHYRERTNLVRSSCEPTKSFAFVLLDAFPKLVAVRELDLRLDIATFGGCHDGIDLRRAPLSLLIRSPHCH